ncbi:MAG: ABC transporter ATP-binding protein, partial [Trebonia sp.]
MSTSPTEPALVGGADQSRKARARLVDGPVAIEVHGVGKSFRIPEHRVDSLKERAAHPFTRAEYKRLDALREISFDVHRGEFFGIVGRNGSGKSTLLKILASIYRADAGRVRMAGRVAPFIELGVGFNPEMTARENVTLNGVLFGLTRRESQRMLDDVLEFAELREFAELKIKNYSSGMMVRLAFAIMVQADADVMLIDEVLAVGDAAFGQKCMDVFYERRDAGKTIVLVTHDMTTVQDMCDRAVVIHDGEMQYCGDPEQAAMRYFRLNFAGGAVGTGGADPAADRPVALDFNARLDHAQLVDGTGASTA